VYFSCCHRSPGLESKKLKRGAQPVMVLGVIGQVAIILHDDSSSLVWRVGIEISISSGFSAKTACHWLCHNMLCVTVLQWIMEGFRREFLLVVRIPDCAPTNRNARVESCAFSFTTSSAAVSLVVSSYSS
jgi:hypothetical protein